MADPTNEDRPEPGPIELVSPNGRRIVGLKELIPGTARTHSVFRGPDSKVDYEYAGETDIDWDGQETVLENGKRVFIDEGGQEWTEDELVPAPVEEDEDEDESKFVNFYRCPRCDHEWQDEWSCHCDDDCPACGCRHIEPYKSEDADQ